MLDQTAINQQKTNLIEMVDEMITEWRVAAGKLETFWRSDNRDRTEYDRVRTRLIEAHSRLVGLDRTITVLGVNYWLDEEQRKVLRNL